MLRGNAFAKIDEKGRLKLPSAFRSIIEPRFGNQFFVTSILGDCVEVYPLPVYSEIEQRLMRSSHVDPAVTKMRSAVSYYGQSAAMDGQGRILIHPLLRESASLDGEVTVLGAQDHLVVWNRRVFEERLKTDPITQEDLVKLAALGF
jgi:MraZ protein